jgi:ADP-ribosylglycohydrolase
LARPIPIADRARGALLGLALGYAVGDSGGELVGEGALALLLAEELVEPEVDLRRIAERWIAWVRRDGRGLGPETVDALEHIARYDALRPAGRGATEAGPLVRALPIGIAAATQPRNLVSGTWHTIMLTHSDPATAWSGVALNVALAQLLQGRRDFLPDVIEALLANDGAPGVLSAARRIPFVQRDELDGGGHPAIACAEVALWTAHQESRIERAFSKFTAGSNDSAAVTAALLGAREGEGALPPGNAPESDRLRMLAKKLVTPRSLEPRA